VSNYARRGEDGKTHNWTLFVAGQSGKPQGGICAATLVAATHKSFSARQRLAWNGESQRWELNSSGTAPFEATVEVQWQAKGATGVKSQHSWVLFFFPTEGERDEEIECEYEANENLKREQRKKTEVCAPRRRATGEGEPAWLTRDIEKVRAEKKIAAESAHYVNAYSKSYSRGDM